MEDLVNRILTGDKRSLTVLICSIQNTIFNIALRFLWSKEDAEDATQEIIIKVVTNLSRFEGKSSFQTWVYRISVNHLLNIKKSKMEEHLSFSTMGEDLIKGLQSRSYDLPDKDLLSEEVKIGCTTAMLVCLNRDLRVAYILGEVFELDSTEASEALQITPENFRKRLSNARSSLMNFMESYGGLLKSKNPCRCKNRIQYAIDTGKVNRGRLNFVSSDLIINSKSEMEKLYSTTDIFKTHPVHQVSTNKSDEIIRIVNNLQFIMA